MTSPAAPMSVTALEGIPEVSAGDDLAALLVDALLAKGIELVDGDVLVVSSKVVSKALGLGAAGGDRDAVVLSQTRRVVAERRTSSLSSGDGAVTRIVESLAGPVMAAAGVDASNTGPADLLLLPHDPDGAARDLLDTVGAAWARATGNRAAPRIGVILSDTAGRPWRIGQTDFALGAAGVNVVDDLRGSVDADGRPLSVTVRCVADEAAAAADLVKGKDRRVGAAHLRGVAELVLTSIAAPAGSPIEGARGLVRTGASDWFGHGTYEAVRAALGVQPGSADAIAVGIPGVVADSIDLRIDRACRLAQRGITSVSVRVEIPAPARGRSGTDDATAAADPAVVTLAGGDPVELGMVIGRLLPALWAERLCGEIAREHAGSGDHPQAIVRIGARADTEGLDTESLGAEALGTGARGTGALSAAGGSAGPSGAHGGASSHR